MKKIFKIFCLLLIVTNLIFICVFYVNMKNQENTIIDGKNKINTRLSKSNSASNKYRNMKYSICLDYLKSSLNQLSKFGYGHSFRPNVLYNSLNKYGGSIVKNFILEIHPEQLNIIVDCYHTGSYKGKDKDFVNKLIDIYGD